MSPSLRAECEPPTLAFVAAPPAFVAAPVFAFAPPAFVDGGRVSFAALVPDAFIPSDDGAADALGGVTVAVVGDGDRHASPAPIAIPAIAIPTPIAYGAKLFVARREAGGGSTFFPAPAS